MTRLRGGAPAPEKSFPILPLRTGVLFPGTTLVLNVGRPRSVALLLTLHDGDVIGLIPQKDTKQVEPGSNDLHSIGTYARVLRVSRVGESGYRLEVEGIGRFRLDSIESSEPFFRANATPIEETEGDTDRASLLAESLTARVRETGSQAGGALDEVLEHAHSPGELADRVAAALPLDTEKALSVVEKGNIPDRLERVLELLGQAKVYAELRTKIEHDVRSQFGKHQREAVLREQLKAIRKELGEGEGGEDDISRLRKRLDEAELPPEARKIADRELGRLEAGKDGPEANVIRTYLDWFAALPWNKRSSVNDDIGKIADKLDRDHYGLEEVKKRILEHMAVYKLSGNPRGTILCLVGPPGVGKTSLGQSIADATGRPFLRIALGGVRDEAEIRGHRRTYVGALPGRILHALRKAEAKNPVVLLDEVDKLSAGWGGSPEAALLEVLDPEQNHTFTDHYLETPFDLSEVLFIATANTLENMAAPLRDRMEVVELSGYTSPEKAHIARKHLVPKRLKEAGIPESAFNVTDAALSRIIDEYTREAGVRQLDREIMRLCRSTALEVARRGDDAAVSKRVDAPDLDEMLGKARFRNDVRERTSVPGVATGLAWTPFGGDILFIETSAMPGKGQLEITGQLGDVMKESARAALSYVRSHAAELRVVAPILEQRDLHIHVPAGAVPKDGPSAGVTMFTALASLLTNRAVRADTAMTGECTLRGRVLPVGGIKAKLLAAHRAGIRRVILPKQNERDLKDVPDEALRELEIVLADDMREVLEAALEPQAAPLDASSGSGSGNNNHPIENVA
jgi:ATP-dependent Lon protease